MDDVTRIFDEHHPSLFRYLVRFCGDADVAADAAQEAFVRLIERRPTQGTERTWLFKVATNVVLEQARTATRRARLLDAGDPRAPMGDAPPDPFEQVAAAERRTAVNEALQLLSDKERTALLMREEGFAHREIAEAVGTTTASVGTLLARALERLARRIPVDPEERARKVQ